MPFTQTLRCITTVHRIKVAKFERASSNVRKRLSALWPALQMVVSASGIPIIIDPPAQIGQACRLQK